MADSVRIFVSHSHDDLEYCRAFVNGLRVQHLDVWYDEHNLGWGALRPVIEREMAAREHFVAILSPAAVASEWVNAEIDAAVELLRIGTLRTFLLVVAERCSVPLLLRRYKRIEGSDGAPVSVEEAITRMIRVVSGLESSVGESPQATTVKSPPPIPPDRFPARLSELGYTAKIVEGRICGEVIVPPVCDVPAGAFFMGSDPHRDKEAQDDERPQCHVTLRAYQIARFPVTVAEYACFVRGRFDALFPKMQLRFAGWPDQLQRLDHPVVSPIDNLGIPGMYAYAAWLARMTLQPWRLATEAEWEKAARWDSTQNHARIYPWGDTFDRSRCNSRESGIGTTTPVGAYPTGASPCGAQDMAGNVWEWTSSQKKAYPYVASDGREQHSSFKALVLRGGSWFDDARNARAASRATSGRTHSASRTGFRLVCEVPDWPG